MKRFGLFLVASALAVSSQAVAGREDQWVFRKELGDGSASPTAIFMAWDYSSVVFRATCDRGRHDFVLEYFGDGERALAIGQSLSVRRGDTVKFATRLVEHHLEGRSKLSPRLMRVLSGSGQLEIDAPNIQGEPWYVGRADALSQMARTCA